MLSLQTITLLAQTPAAGARGATIESMWDFVVKGGVLMVPIGLCSLLALAIIVERAMSLRRHKIIPPGFRAGVEAALGPHRNVAGALEYCRCANAPVGEICAAALARLHEPAELLERHIEQAGERAVAKLRKYLRALTVIASIAPLLGLLGTIFGMITAFQTVAAAADALGRTELLAKGIYEALITTAAGLIVAIPAIVAYHALAAKIDRLVGEIDALTVEFVEGAVLNGGSAADPRPSLRVEPAADVQETETLPAGAL